MQLDLIYKDTRENDFLSSGQIEFAENDQEIEETHFEKTKGNFGKIEKISNRVAALFRGVMKFFEIFSKGVFVTALGFASTGAYNIAAIAAAIIIILGIFKEIYNDPSIVKKTVKNCGETIKEASIGIANITKIVCTKSTSVAREITSEKTKRLWNRFFSFQKQKEEQLTFEKMKRYYLQSQKK